MDLLDRIYHFHQILHQARHPVSMSTLTEKLECSRATVSRIIRQMRDYLAAPIEYDRTQNGYYYEHLQSERYQLPGLWFTVSELHALLTLQQLFANSVPGFLGSCLAPVQDQVNKLLNSRHLGGGDVSKRIRILPMNRRRIESNYFNQVAGAVLQRLCLGIDYHGRARDKITRRIISPQRLVYYRDNWYLDAWDHDKQSLRSFAVDRILKIFPHNDEIYTVAESELDEHFTRAYGIFSGNPGSEWALLRFSAHSARWVADEQWHPQQMSYFLEDGRYEIHIPYSDPRELIMDVLKYGEDAEVIRPKVLREQVANRLEKALGNYQ